MKLISIISFFIFFSVTALSQKTYTNPLNDTLRIADPFILKQGDFYYLYGTNSSSNGFKAWKSKNLINWNSIGLVFQKNDSTWGKNSFWAPEVIFYHQKYYMVYSCSGKTMYGNGLRICIAVSDSPEGPFNDLYAPLFDAGFGTIDGHLYIENEKPYLYYEMVGAVGNFSIQKGFLWGVIMGVELANDLSGPISEQKLCIYPSQEWEGINSMKARSNEGMTVFKIDSTYYMTYSGNHYEDPNYGVGYATSDRPLGGLWTKYERNPILKNNLKQGISGPGHNSITFSPNGKEMFMVYHTHENPAKPSGQRVLNIDRMVVDKNGGLRVIGPTNTAQKAPSSSQ